MLSHTGAVGDLKRDLLNRKSKEGKLSAEFCMSFSLFSVVIEKSSSGARTFYSTTQLFFLMCP